MPVIQLTIDLGFAKTFLARFANPEAYPSKGMILYGKYALVYANCRPVPTCASRRCISTAFVVKLRPHLEQSSIHTP